MAKLNTSTGGTSAEEILGKVKKHYFWGVVPILLIVAFLVTSAAKTTIRKKFETKRKAAEDAKAAVDKIAANKLHPNDSTIEAIRGETNVLKKSVFEAWTLMYDDQKRRNRWPRQLSREFLGIVEKLKFRAPIAPSSSKQYLLEDYSFFIGTHLPELLKQVSRRRCQVHDYKWIAEEKRFFPVYIDRDKNVYYIIVTEGESGTPKEVRTYDIKRNITTVVKDSAQRAAFLGLKHEPYYRELDPMIVSPKDHINYSTSSATMGAGAGMGMGMEGMGGGMEMGAGPGMEMGGGPMGSRGSAGAESFSSLTATPIPGDGIDPALEEVGGGAGGRAGAQGMGPGPEMGMGGGTASETAKLPGLPPYKERRRIVGNVDWPNPEIYSLPTWPAGSYPLSIEIWYAQESLWVYESLIRVIRQTNEEAGDNVTVAPVKRIDNLLIGQEAGVAWKAIESPIGDLTGSGLARAGMEGMMSMSGSESMMSGGAGGSGGAAGGASGPGMEGGANMGGRTEQSALRGILLGRYLDATNAPLPADTAPPFAEFNRMPICLKLVVDQRRIPDILVNCANCSMPIDIKHVRICPDNAIAFSMPAPGSVGGVGSSTGGAMGGEMGMGGGMPQGGGAMGGPQGGGAMGGGAMGGGSESGIGSTTGGIEIGRSEISQTGGYGVDAIRIEIYGIINIFNEPSLADFGTGKGAAGDATLTEETLNATPSAAEKIAADSAATEKSATPAAPATPATPATPAPATPAPATPATPATPAPATPATPATPAPATPATPATPAPATPATPATPAPTT